MNNYLPPIFVALSPIIGNAAASAGNNDELLRLIGNVVTLIIAYLIGRGRKRD